MHLKRIQVRVKMKFYLQLPDSPNQGKKSYCNQIFQHKRPTLLCCSVNGDDEEANRYIHKEDGVKCKSFSPRVNGRAHERICSPRAPCQCHGHHDHLNYHVESQHAN